MAQRTAIAARISPYPRSVAPQDGDGSAGSRKVKRAAKRREALASRPGPRPAEEPRFNVGPRRTAGSAPSTRRTRRAITPGRDLSGSLSADEDIPDYPPPSFQEAMQDSQVQPSSSHLLQQQPACASLDQSLFMSTQSFHSAAERRVESPPIDSPLSDNGSNDSLQILDEVERSRTPDMYTCRCGSTRRLDDSDLRREVSIERPANDVPAHPAYPTPVSPTPTKRSHAWLAPLRTLIPSRLNSCKDVMSPTSASAPVTPSAPFSRNHFLESASMPTPRTPTAASISTRTPLSPNSTHSFRKDISRRLFSRSKEPSIASMDEQEDEEAWVVVDSAEVPRGPPEAAPWVSIETCPPDVDVQVMQPQVVRRPNPPRIRTDFSMATTQAADRTPAQATPTPAAYSSMTPGLTMGTTPATMTPVLATPTTATATFMTAATSGTETYMTAATSTAAPAAPSHNDNGAHYTGRPLPLLPRRLQRKVVDSTFAGPADEAYWRNERANGRVPEGMLIDL
ncbi:hypothetical protein HDZ31DRAFT_82333 [Schizophyllum fasciatum]